MRKTLATAGPSLRTAGRGLRLSAAAAQRLKKRQEERELKRRSQRDRRARELLASAQAPVDIQRKKREKKVEEEWTFRPAVSGEVPDLDGKFIRWKRRMDAARRARRKKYTRPDVSGLSMFGEEAREREERRRAMREERKQEEMRKDGKKTEGRVMPTYGKGPKVVMTKAEELRLAIAMKRKENQAKEQSKLRRKEMERAARACAVGKAVRARVRQVERERQATPGYISLEEAQRKAREKAKAFQRQYKGNPDAPITEETRSRALLIDGSREESRRARRKRDALVRAASVIDKKMGVSQAFDEAEKEALDLDTEPTDQ